MIEFKRFIAEQMIGKKLHFKCNCLIPINGSGIIKGYEIVSQEIIFKVEIDGRIIKIGENHPNLFVSSI